MTVPSFTVVLEVTVAVKVTELFGGLVNDGLLFEDTEVVGRSGHDDKREVGRHALLAPSW